MPTPIGTDTLTSISRHVILPSIIDQVYQSNALFWRLNRANKKQYEGGLHIEQPFMTSTWGTVGEYSGFDLLDTTPQDNIINGGWDLRQYYAAVSIDTRTLARANSEMAVANILKVQWEQARIGLADRLGTDFWGSNATGSGKKIDGLKDIVDAGTVATSYAGLLRSGNTFLNANMNTTSATLTLSVLRSLISDCTKGGHTPSSLWGRKEQYNRLWALQQAFQQFPVGPGLVDDAFAQAGFRHLWFDQIPFCVDDKVFDGPNTSNSAIVALNEDLLQISLWSSTDFEMEDLRKPVNQQALVGFLHWWGNLIHPAPQLNGALTAIAG